MVKSRFVKWCLAAILAVALFIDSAAVNAAPSDNGGKRIGLSDAVQWGLKVSSELADAKAELAKKRTELQQAQQAVKSQEAKDRSLFAKPHSLSKDLEIQMKLPEAKKQLAEAEQTWNAKQRKVKYDVESLYMAAVQASLNEDGAKGKLTEAEKQEKDARQKMKLGAVSKEDADGASKRLEKAQSDLKVASLAAKSTRLALGAKIGQDFDKPVSFAFEPYYANLKQDRLNGYIAASEKTNLELFKAAESRKLAESKVATTRKLYVGKFGKGPTRAIESLYKAQDTDTEAFMAAYDQMLAAIKKKWEGFFWLLVIPIPKSLLQGEYDGLRYFDDQKYSLPVSMLDLNKAMLQEKDARKSAIDNVKQSYLAAKSAEEAYVQAMRARDKAKDDAAAAEKKFKLGLAVKDDLEQAKEAAAGAEKSVASGQFGYISAVSKLNYDTGGALEGAYRPGDLPYQDVDDGLQPMTPAANLTKGLSGKWSVKQTVPSMIGEFSVKLDKAASKQVKADKYALFAASGMQIGPAVKLSKPIKQLSFVFGSMDTLTLKLYKKDVVVAEGKFEGYGADGVVTLTPVKDGKTEKPAADNAGQAGNGKPDVPVGSLIIGSYIIHRDALTPANFIAAQKTLEPSGQGILYKSEYAGGQWFTIENATDLSAIADPRGSTAVAAEQVAGMSFLLKIEKPGAAAPMKSADDLRKARETIAKDRKKLQEQYDEAQADSKVQELSKLAADMKELDAQGKLLEALQQGDGKAADAQLALIGSSDAAADELAAEGSNPPSQGGAGGSGGAGQGGVGGSGSGGAGTTEPTQEELTAAADELEEQLDAAIANGTDAQAIDSLLAKLLDARLKAEIKDSGSAEALEALALAKGKLEGLLAEAGKQGDEERADLLADSIRAVEEQIVLVKGEELALAKAIAEEHQQTLNDAGISSPMLQEKLDGLSAELQAAAKRKYTDEELKQLAEDSRLIEEASDGAVSPLPVESIVSSDLDFKFDVPPVNIYGNTYIQIRPLLEAFGASVFWDNDAMNVTVSKDDTTIVCEVGSSIAYVNGEPADLGLSAVLVLGRAMVPLRFVAETLGLDVTWNAASGTIDVNAG